MHLINWCYEIWKNNTLPPITLFLELRYFELGMGKIAHDIYYTTLTQVSQPHYFEIAQDIYYEHKTNLNLSFFEVGYNDILGRGSTM